MVTATAPLRATSQKPPASVETYEFSLSRKTGKFRFRLGEDEWLCSRLAGHWEMAGTDNAKGNLRVRCRLALKGDTAYVYAPADAEPEEMPEGAQESHWRLCYNRQGKTWRIRDERTSQLHSSDIASYRGVMNVNWFDAGTHVFHDGRAYIDGKGVAHFGD